VQPSRCGKFPVSDNPSGQEYRLAPLNRQSICAVQSLWRLGFYGNHNGMRWEPSDPVEGKCLR